MAPPVLYSTVSSPACRGVLLAVTAAGIEVDVKETSLQSKDHFKPDFLKLNPQHTIPTLDDDGFAIGDSHAIVTYLIDKYAKDDSLYPKDLEKRTVINQRLHFDNAVLNNIMREIVIPVLYRSATDVPEDRLKSLEEAYGFLEKFLANNDWLAGNTYTLADTSIIASVSSLTAFLSLDKFPKLAAWAKRCENEIPGYAKANAQGATLFHNILGGKLKFNRGDRD